MPFEPDQGTQQECDTKGDASSAQRMPIGHSYLLSANFRAGTIDLKKGDAGSPDLAGKFTDPNLPAGFAPFNIQTIWNKVYVTYALRDSTGHDDVPGAGHGFVSAFDLQGNFLGRIGAMGTLNSPWGLAIAPSSFGSLAGDLLVGNFGDGHINAFNPTTGHFLGQLTLSNGQPFQEDNLWALSFGNGAVKAGVVTAPTNTLYFTAGIDNQQHGLFGSLQADSTVSVHAPILPNLPGTVVQSFSTVPANGDDDRTATAPVPQPRRTQVRHLVVQAACGSGHEYTRRD